MITAEQLTDPEWNKKRSELEDKLMQVANELATHTDSQQLAVQNDVLTVTVSLRAFQKRGNRCH